MWVSVIGCIYQWGLLRRFGINIFDFASPADFLLAGFRQPLAIGPTAIVIVVLSVLLWPMKQSDSGRRGWYVSTRRWARDLYEKHEITKYVFLALIISNTVLGAWEVARHDASNTVDGWGVYVHAEFTTDAANAAVLPDSATVLLGTTHDFLFLYRRDTKQSYVLPVAAIAQLRVCDASRPGWHFLMSRFIGWPFRAWLPQGKPQPCRP